jgi:hypothetical protein
MRMTENDTGAEEAEMGLEGGGGEVDMRFRASEKGVVVVWDLLNMQDCLGLGFTR